MMTIQPSRQSWFYTKISSAIKSPKVHVYETMGRSVSREGLEPLQNQTFGHDGQKTGEEPGIFTLPV
jgi:hypothetical protein